MKLLYGATIGNASGSIAGTTYSRNRYGAYTRNRTRPVVSTSTAAINQKAIFGDISRSWQGLSAANKQAWKDWAAQNPVIDRLGVSQVLAPNVAYMKCAVTLQAFGVAPYDNPPNKPAPITIIPASVSATTTPQALSITLSDTDLPDDIGLQIYGVAPGSSGVNYVENLMKLVSKVTAGTASPISILTGWTAQWGAITTGERIILDVYAVDITTGLKSPRYRWIQTAT